MCGSPGICGHLFTAGDPAAYYEWKPESEKSELYSPPLQKRITLNTGQKMPLINCGGTAATVPGHHDSYSNYSSFLQQGGRGIDTALTYGAVCCMWLCVQWQWQWQWQWKGKGPLAVAVAVARRDPIPNLPFLTRPPQRYTDPINIQIAAAIKAHPEIPREELWVTTKVPCCPNPQLSFCNDGEYNGTIAEAMRRNNALLQLRSTDITLVRHVLMGIMSAARMH